MDSDFADACCAMPVVPQGTESMGSPLVARTGAEEGARRLLRDFDRQEDEEIKQLCTKKSHCYLVTESVEWTQLDPEVERLYLDDPMRDYDLFFTRERREKDLSGINGEWLAKKLKSIAARNRLAETRMIRRFTTQLS